LPATSPSDKLQNTSRPVRKVVGKRRLEKKTKEQWQVYIEKVGAYRAQKFRFNIGAPKKKGPKTNGKSHGRGGEKFSNRNCIGEA